MNMNRLLFSAVDGVATPYSRSAGSEFDKLTRNRVSSMAISTETNPLLPTSVRSAWLRKLRWGAHVSHE
jgi:hypothetical protein